MSNPTPIIWYNAAGERWCTRCKAYMAVETFHRNRASTAGDGLQRYCRVCSRDVRRHTYEQRREAEIAYARAWRAAHPARVRLSQRRAHRVTRLRKRLARIELLMRRREELAG